MNEDQIDKEIYEARKNKLRGRERHKKLQFYRVDKILKKKWLRSLKTKGNAQE